MLGLQLKNQRLFSLLLPVMTLGMNGLALAIYWVGAALVEAISVADMAARLTMFTNVIVFSTYATYVVMSFMMLAMIFMLLPQAQVAVHVADKDAALENMGVQNAIAEAEAALAGEGRVLVRKSGTESVIRVLAEAPDQAAADAAMKRIASALEAL